MVSVDVIIPHGKDDPAGRVKVRDFIAAHWHNEHPDYTVHLTGCPTTTWSKGAAANHAIDSSQADVIILADADSWAPPRSVTRGAIEAATQTGWAVPFTVVGRIGKTETALILAGERIPRPALEQRPRRALPGGGIVIARRDVWQKVRGVDPRFTGWGGEDQALGAALHTLAGKPWQPPSATLWHLWHPSNARRPNQTTRALWSRYRAAKGRPEAMTAIIEEW